jgi:hypothetical protein
VIRDRFVRRPGQALKEMSFAQLMSAGTLAGVFQMAATYPIETVRTRMTLSVDLAGGVKYEGILHCARQTVAIEGWRALYKGATFPLHFLFFSYFLSRIGSCVGVGCAIRGHADDAV